LVSFRRDLEEEFDGIMKGEQRQTGKRVALALLFQCLRVKVSNDRKTPHRRGSKGTARDPSAALQSYLAAAKAGNFVALAFLAKLLSHSSERADTLWGRFFAKLKANPEQAFTVAGRGELLHDYITTQLQLGFEPEHMEVIRRHRVEIAGHHQRLLEHAPADRLDRLGGAMNWIEMNLGPWPI
jgi:hypothetical protein